MVDAPAIKPEEYKIMSQTLFEEIEPKTEKAPKPHYHGHRDRLRARVRENGPKSLQDYEILELILFSAIPRKDVKPIAKEIMSHFGGLPEFLGAPETELLKINGISDNTATMLRAITELSHRAMKHEIMQKPVLNRWSRLIDYCQTTMAHETKELFRVIFLNKKNEMIADEIQGSGTVDHTPAYPREIMKRALELGATAMILVHNHPSGDPKPSNADVEMTGQIIRAAEPFNILIHDHIIVSKHGYSSFKNLGLL